MGKQLKDTEYLPISARIKILETRLLTGEQMERLLTDRGETARILQECGYPPFSADRPEEMDAALSKAREDTLLDLGADIPDKRYLDLFKLKYDYHNVKAVLKAKAVGTDPASMLVNLGRVPAQDLRSALEGGKRESLPPLLAAAADEAAEVLQTTRDPQLSDMVLDRAYYRDMKAVADDTGSEFLAGYVRVSIDSANLRALVRTLRMGKNADFFAGAVFEGGNLPADAVVRAAREEADGIRKLYEATPLRAAAEKGADALSGGALTDFERLCDDAVSVYLAGSRLIPFGEAPLLCYLAARETEYTNLRIILMGRRAGLSPDIIRSRLRASGR